MADLTYYPYILLNYNQDSDPDNPFSPDTVPDWRGALSIVRYVDLTRPAYNGDRIIAALQTGGATAPVWATLLHSQGYQTLNGSMNTFLSVQQGTLLETIDDLATTFAISDLDGLGLYVIGETISSAADVSTANADAASTPGYQDYAIQIDGEVMYITAINAEAGTVTVERGILYAGSTATAHTAGAAVTRFFGTQGWYTNTAKWGDTGNGTRYESLLTLNGREASLNLQGRLLDMYTTSQMTLTSQDSISLDAALINIGDIYFTPPSNQIVIGGLTSWTSGSTVTTPLNDSNAGLILTNNTLDPTGTITSGGLWNLGGVLKFRAGATTKSVAFLEGAAFTGNISTTGNLTVDGNTTLGNAAGDILTVNAATISIPSNSIDPLALKPGTIDSTELGYLNGVSSNIQNQFTGKQAADATLTALAAYNTNGLLTQTAADTFTGRSIDGTTNQIDITNPAGTAGNPKVSITTNPILPGNVTTGGTLTVTGTTSLGDNATFTNAADRTLAIAARSTAGTGRTLTLTGGGANGLNATGGHLYLQSGPGTGFAESGNIYLQGWTPGASGSTLSTTPNTLLTLSSLNNEATVNGNLFYSSGDRVFQVNAPAATSPGGYLLIAAARGAGSNQAGGALYLRGGAGTGTGTPGTVNIDTTSTTTSGAATQSHTNRVSIDATNTTVNNNLVVNGTTTLGDAVTDATTINGTATVSSTLGVTGAITSDSRVKSKTNGYVIGWDGRMATTNTINASTSLGPSTFGTVYAIPGGTVTGPNTHFDIINLEAWGDFGITGTPTLRLRLQIVSTTGTENVFDTGAVTQTAAGQWYMRHVGQIGVPTTNQIAYRGVTTLLWGAGSAPATRFNVFASGLANSWTTDKEFRIEVTWGTLSASNTITLDRMIGGHT